MKKTMVSLAAASLIATSAMAADKGIDIETTGQAVIYYNTLGNNAQNGADLFKNKANTKANFGIQLNLNADLKNNFTFGSQINYLGTLGLEKGIVGATMQNTNGGIAENNIADDIYLSKIFIAKKMGNTTIKLGRQELPKSLSPLAFSEGWNVFKNTFDAMLLVNSDIPNTTVVAAYVAKGNGNGFGNNMSSYTDLVVKADAGTAAVGGSALMLTVANKSIPMTAITASYYNLRGVNVTSTPTPAGPIALAGSTTADAIWLDVKIADKSLPMGLNVGLQGGVIMPDDYYTPTLAATVKFDDTTAYGIKVGMKPTDAFSLCLAYTSVDGNDNKANVAVKNTTGVKTPLYTQMVANQDWIALDSDTFMLKGVFNLGDAGKIIAQGSYSSTGKSSLKTYTNNAGVTDGQELTDLELLYKFKAMGVNFLAAYISQDFDKNAGLAGATAADHNDIIRFVARYNF